MRFVTILNKTKTLAAIACSFLFISSSCWATTYYVDNVSGSDLNSGTSTMNPWKTIAKVNSIKFQPGDQILFQKGQTWREIIAPATAGASGSPITYGAYGSGDKPVIMGSDVVTGWSQYSGNTYRVAFSTPVKWPCVYTNHPSYPSLVRGTYTSLSAGQFDLDSNGYLYINIGTSPSSYKIESIKREQGVKEIRGYIKIDGLHLTKAQTGVQQWSYPAPGCEVTNCTIDWESNMGIYSGSSGTVNGTNWHVANNTFDHCGSYPPASGTAGKHGIYTKWADGWLVEGNSFTNCGYNQPNGGFGMDVNGSSNFTIRYNYFSKNWAGSVQFFQDTSGPCLNNKVYYNVSVGDKRFIYLGGGSGHSGNVAYNNTAYGFTYSGVDVESSNTTGLTIKNNILWSSVSGVRVYKVDSGCALVGADYNDVGPAASGFISYNGGSYSTLSAFKQANSKYDAHSISADPLFVSAPSNLQLSSGSPCRKVGTSLSLTQDYDGTSLAAISTPDLGAYQYGGTTLSAPVSLLVQ